MSRMDTHDATISVHSTFGASGRMAEANILCDLATGHCYRLHDAPNGREATVTRALVLPVGMLSALRDACEKGRAPIYVHGEIVSGVWVY